MTPKFPKTLHDAIKYFADPETCQGYLVRLRWPDGVFCARCGDTDVYYVKTRRIWQCKGCKRQFSVKVGSIFEDSPIGLDKCTAVWLIASAKNGISSYELHRAIGVTQKSAWFMLHRIRLAMQTGSFGWLTVWLIASAKNGISSYELHRAIGVTAEIRVVHAAPNRLVQPDGRRSRSRRDLHRWQIPEHAQG